MNKDKLEQWIDRSIAQFMKLTDEIESGASASELKEVPIFQPLPPHAEASDYLSINEWIESRDDNSSQM